MDVQNSTAERAYIPHKTAYTTYIYSRFDASRLNAAPDRNEGMLRKIVGVSLYLALSHSVTRDLICEGAGEIRLVLFLV